MSVFNGEQYLDSCMNSVLNQTFSDFEFVIVNDGSTDRTKEILADYESKDKRIKIIEQENRGLTKALNRGLNECRGECIARIDVDDLWHKNKLEIQHKFMLKNKDVVLLGTNYSLLDSNDEIISTKEIKDCCGYISNDILCFNPFFHSSVMFRKSVVEAIGSYNERVTYAQDYELWLKLWCKHPVFILEDILAYRRLNDQCISKRREKQQRFFVFKYKLKYLSKIILNPRACFYLFKDLAVACGVKDLRRR